MPLLRINACGDQPQMHNSPRDVATMLRMHRGDGPVIVMIHGYKYRPNLPDHCPHLHILALHPRDMPWRAPSWPRQLGFGTGHVGEGLGIAFGWDSRGALWSAERRTRPAGRALAQVLRQLHDQQPGRPVHLIAHSMGIALALEALHHLPAGAVQRIVSMTGAAYATRALEALGTPAGRACDFINVTSRENDLFEFLYERLIAPPARGERTLGFGLSAHNAVTLQLDCDDTLALLARRGAPVAPPQRRICHWSSYTRQGVLRFYNDLLRQPETWALDRLRRDLPDAGAPRWSRLIAPPQGGLALPMTQNPT
ncbi:MAG: hypothetical protein CML02_14680 [Pseudooceanicola sp.]|jgi:pimeloyl-ACP methyl ester carboxylesterase|nr:hypothetical protein [Pseudooceanicola sp.]